MNLLEQLASGLLNYSRSEPEGLLARGLRQPAGLLGRGLNNAINMQGPGLLAQQDAFFRPSVMATPDERRQQGAAFLQNIASGPLGFAPMGWTAYHGSPHKFDKFSLEKIGTGEGAQAYGHGLYMADSPAVAKSYQEALGELQILHNGKPVGVFDKDAAANAAHQIRATGGDIEKAIKRATAIYDGKWRDSVVSEIRKLGPGEVTERLGGHLYKVDIDDARAPKEAFLDWDKPLSQQSESVRKALEGIQQNFTGRVGGHMTGEQFYQHMQRIANSTTGGGQAKVSEMLREAGIPGLRYLDAGSRASGGTYNTVLFDDSLVKILERQ